MAGLPTTEMQEGGGYIMCLHDQIKHLEAEVANLTQERDEFAQGVIDQAKIISYMLGIAERGTGKICPNNIRPEVFLLEYVKDLERADIRRSHT